ncbi:MAG: hypothetical protein ACRDYC_00795, partial [Acidimicrobiales bacterium]
TDNHYLGGPVPGGCRPHTPRAYISRQLGDSHLRGPASLVGPDADDLMACGYAILQAENAEAAQSLLDGHPHLAIGGSIDVQEMIPIPGME